MGRPGGIAVHEVDVKYAIFALAVVIAVPLMTAVALSSEKARGWLLSAALFSICLGDHGSINFFSLETYRGPDRGFEVTLTDLIVGALILATVARRPGRVAWLPFNSLWMLLFFLASAGSMGGTAEPILSAFTLFKMLRGYALYWCVANCLRTGVPLRAVWNGMVGLATFLVGLGVWQKFVLRGYRISLVFPHPNAVALVLNQFMPLTLAFGLLDRIAWRSYLSLVLALGMLFTVVVTFSRTGMVVGAVAALLVLWYANRRARSFRVTLSTMVVVGGIAVGGALVAPSILDRFREAPESSALARVEFNEAAWQMTTDFPLGGVGINQYSQMLTANAKYRSNMRVMANEEQGGVCHHIYRLTLAEVGWPGLVLFVGVLLRFWGRAVWVGWRRRTPDGMLQMALAAGAMALHLSGFFEWAFRITPIFYMFNACCGLSTGLADLARMGALDDAPPARRVGPAPAVDFPVARHRG